MNRAYSAAQFEPVRSVVETAVAQWNNRLRKYIRDETRLKLQTEDKRYQVPVRVVGQWPPAVAALLEDVTNPICPLLQAEIVAIGNLQHGAERVAALVQQLADADSRWKPFAEGSGKSLANAGAIAEALLGFFDRHCDVLSRILLIDDDVLGCYFSGDYESFPSHRIEIYYPVIGLVAAGRRIDPEALTVVVLAHELGHAYSHLGLDIDGRSWDDFAFAAASRQVKEGIAQYITDQITGHLQPENPEIRRAYETLLEEQSETYRVHLPWVAGTTPEAVRATLLVCRNQQLRTLEEFESVLADASKALVKMETAKP